MRMINLRKLGTMLVLICLGFVPVSLNAQETESAREEQDACKMIMEENIGAILGEPVKKSERTLPAEGLKGISPFTQCRFMSTESDKQASILVRQGQVNQSEPAEVRSSLESMGNVQDVSGVGDKAFWGSQQLNVFRGDDLYIVVTVSGLSDDVALEKAKAIGQEVLKQIP